MHAASCCFALSLCLSLHLCPALKLTQTGEGKKSQPHMDTLLSFSLSFHLLCCQTPSQTHTRRDRHSLGVEQGNHAAAPLARLIKPAHLCLIPHLEQVAASPEEPSLSIPPPPTTS